MTGALRVLRKDIVHAVSDAIAEIVADVAYLIQPGVEGVPTVDGQCNRNGMGLLERTFARLDTCSAGRLPCPTAAPLGGTNGVFLLVPLQLGQSVGWRRDSSNVLCLVAAGRSAGPL